MVPCIGFGSMAATLLCRKEPFEFAKGWLSCVLVLRVEVIPSALLNDRLRRSVAFPSEARAWEVFF